MDHLTSVNISHCPGQGAIGIEIRKDREDLKRIITQINNLNLFSIMCSKKKIH